MANKEQLRILKEEGVEAWNEYRKSHSDIKINLRGANLSKQNLSGADFSNADIRSTNFTNATLKKADFCSAKCGLQKRWTAPLIFFSLFVATAVSGFVGIIARGYINFILSIDNPLKKSPDIFFPYNKYLFDEKDAEIIVFLGSIIIIFTLFYFVSHKVNLNLSLLFTLYISGSIFIVAGIMLAIIEAKAHNDPRIIAIKTISFVHILVLVASEVSKIISITTFFTVAGIFTEKILNVRSKTMKMVIMILPAYISFNTATKSINLISNVPYTTLKIQTGLLRLLGLYSYPIIEIGTTIIELSGIYIGWQVLKKLQENDLINSLAINYAAIKGTNFFEADLTDAYFIKARLKNVDLREAILTRVSWSGAKMLDRVRPGDTYLKEAQVRQWLIGKGTDKNFDGKNLHGVNLQGADLTDASCINTDLSEADLSNTTLTGACIEDWNINSETKLDNIICDYIYLKQVQQERRPSNPNRNFKPGEFAKLVQKSVKTVDLIFKKGVDWQAVAYSLKSTQVLNGDTPLTIQSIENKEDGVVLIKVNVPQNADKGKIEGEFWQGYEFANKTLKEQYEARILDKDKEINRLFIIVTQGKEVQKLMAEQPKFQQNFNAPVNAVAQNVEGNQNVYASEQKQTLAEAADEIQKLLKQLEETNPTATVEQQQAYVNAAIPPTLKQRCVGALKAGGEVAIEEFLDNSYVNVGKAVVKAWIKPE